MEWTQKNLKEEIENSVKRAEAILNYTFSSDAVDGYARMALANIEFAKLLIDIGEKHYYLLPAADYLD